MCRFVQMTFEQDGPSGLVNGAGPCQILLMVSHCKSKSWVISGVRWTSKTESVEICSTERELVTTKIQEPTNTHLVWLIRLLKFSSFSCIFFLFDPMFDPRSQHLQLRLRVIPQHLLTWQSPYAMLWFTETNWEWVILWTVCNRHYCLLLSWKDNDTWCVLKLHETLLASASSRLDTPARLCQKRWVQHLQPHLGQQFPELNACSRMVEVSIECPICFH
jgi:hypothetical protein